MHKHLPMDFLRSLVLISDNGNFTKAGEQLGRTQSAISLQMKKLEEIAEQTLFQRQGHNFALTPQGQMLVNYARQILSLNDQALDKLNPRALSGNIRLGIPSEFATSVLPKVLGEFTRTHPQVSLEIACDLSQNLRRGLMQEKYDLIFSVVFFDEHSTQYRETNKTSPLIRMDDLVWVGSHPMKFEPGKEVPLVVAPEGCLYRQRAIHWLTEAKIPWRVAYTIIEISGIQMVLREGIGITVLAKSTVPDKLLILNPPGQDTLGRVGMQLTANPKHHNPAIERLMDYIEKALLQ